MPDYYTKHFQAYHKKTFSIDPSSFLEPLKNTLEPGCRILDIGCGSGRDMLWLKNHGFSVSGFERSAGLAGVCVGKNGSIATSESAKYISPPAAVDLLEYGRMLSPVMIMI